MNIIKCEIEDSGRLAEMNRRLIEDERGDNPMNIAELERRMRGFIAGDYDAYMFIADARTVGYALVNRNVTPVYLRQFYIEREYRRRRYGVAAFEALIKRLKVDTIDLEVLPWNAAGLSFWEKCGFREISRRMRLNIENDEYL